MNALLEKGMRRADPQTWPQVWMQMYVAAITGLSSRFSPADALYMTTLQDDVKRAVATARAIAEAALEEFKSAIKESE